MNKKIRTLIGIAGIVVAIGWSVHGVNFKEVFSILDGINLPLSLTVLALTTCNLGIRAAAWKFVVDPIKPVSIKNALASYLIGVFSNLFLPFKLGDVVLGYSLGRQEKMSKVSILSAVVIMRIFEITTLILLVVTSAAFYSVPLLFKKRTIVLGIVILTVVLLLFVAFNNRDAIIRFAQGILSRFSPRLSLAMREFIELALAGTNAIHRLPDIAKIMSLSLLSWIVQIVMVCLTAHALGIKIDLLISGTVLLAINLGLTLPISPGNIGTFQVFSIIALSWFSVSKTKALTFSVIFQIIQGIPVIIGGTISLFRETVRAPKTTRR